MLGPKEEEELLQAIKDLGLPSEEAQVYFSILKAGKNGIIVKDLAEILPIRRTTIYSIIERLKNQGFISEIGLSNTPKRAMYFVAEKPVRLFERLIFKKKEELQQLHEINLYFCDRLEKIFQKEAIVPPNSLQPFIRPYFRSILQQGWLVTSQNYFNGMQNLGYDVYDYELKDNTNKEHSGGGVLVFVFDHSVENDSATRDFVSQQVKRKAKEDMLREGPFSDVYFQDSNEQFFGLKLPAIITHAKFDGTDSYIPLGRSILFSHKNKVFFVWTENSASLEMLIKIILMEEKLIS